MKNKITLFLTFFYVIKKEIRWEVGISNDCAWKKWNDCCRKEKKESKEVKIEEPKVENKEVKSEKKE